MRLQQIIGGLTPAEKSALKVLDESGRWSLLYDARIDDGWNADGQKRRTFQRRGRCQLVLMRDPTEKHRPTGLFAEPEPDPEIIQEPIKFRPVPWTYEPQEQAPEPEPVELVDRVEPIKADEPEPEPEPDPGPVKVVHKKKKRAK